MEWISVNDRLPKAEGTYICCIKDKKGELRSVAADYCAVRNMWFEDFFATKDEVTHWMPLPEPPKGE